MGLVFIVLIGLSSLILIYQSLAVYGLLASRLSVGVLSDSILSLLSIKISSWGLIFGICGILICVLSFLRMKSDNSLDKQYLIIGVLLIIFSIISVL